MHRKHTYILFVASIGLLCASPLPAQEPLGTTFTYQGQLQDGGVPANDEYDFIFRLFDDPVGGAQVGGDVEIDEWLVSDGLFTVELDFGAGIFTGDALWLEVSVRLNGGGEYTDLSPRQPLTATPYALYALSSPGGAGFWEANADDIYNTNSGDVGIGTTSPNYPLHVVSADADAVYGESSVSGGVGVYGKASSFEGGGFGVRGDTYSTTGVGIFGIAAMSTGINYGVYGQSQSQTGGRGVYGLGATGTGVNYGVYGQTNSADGWAGYFVGPGYFSGDVGIGTDSPDYALDVAGLAFMDTTDGAGWIGTKGSNSSMNAILGYLDYYPDNGYVGVKSSSGGTMAGMYVFDYTGVIWADEKNFRVPNPNQPGTEIWYACVEGPEAAAYIRGTAHLVNGRATVAFPDHFTAVATSQGMTVQITPHSAESKGLAVVERSIEGFVVRELFSGAGTYDFDYTVMAVRQGYENYRVIRPNTEGLPAGEIEAGKPSDADRIADTEVR